MVDFRKLRLFSKKQTLVALDTETTGLVFRHGCKPFFVSTCDEHGSIRYWKWKVDPIDRTPIIPQDDCQELQSIIDDPTNRFVLHNAKFDVLALQSIGIKWSAWDRTEDTHLASHCLASNEPHGLKDLGIRYLDIDDSDESALQKAVNQARTKARALGWRIAKKNDAHWPWAKTGTWWKCDMWLPAAVASFLEYPKKHPWYTLLDKYAITDAERTIALWMVFSEALSDEDLIDQYIKRRRLLPVVYRMEEHGITIQQSRLQKLRKEFLHDAKTHEVVCKKLSPIPVDNLASSKQLQKVLFDKKGFRLTPTKETPGSKIDQPNFSTTAEDLEPYLDKLDKNSRAWHFVNSLFLTRRNQKAIEYLDSYQLAALPTSWKNYTRLHSTFNIAGTDTTRFSSNNPNNQNVSKKEGFNLRQIFCPPPGFEWYAFDYNNIEMRIFAYQSGDQKLIKAFEDGYSVHLIFAELLYPKEFEECLKKGWDFKKKYKSTLYQWVKNGNFSLIYGAGKTKADKTYHLAGAYDRIRKRMPEIDRFMRAKYEEATTKGYVTTLGGYRLLVPKNGPHKAVNYYVQGSAGWAMLLAMLRIDEYIQALGNEYGLVMTIHDELDIEMPIHIRNLKVVEKCKSLMELSGKDLGLDLPVEVNRITDNWASEELITFTATS